MKISLHNITSNNYHDLCALEVSDEQKKHLTANTKSLVDSMFRETLATRAIMLDDKAVGFCMWDKETPTKVSIWRFMIAHTHQQRGIGRKALELVITELKNNKIIDEIEICYHLDNLIAKAFYAKLGFIETGMSEDNSDMLASIILS